MIVIRKRKVGLLLISVLIFAFVLTSVILSLGGQNVINTNAYNSASTIPTLIGSLNFEDYEDLTNGVVFDASVMDQLYGAITGKKTDTYAHALAEVQKSTSTLNSPVDGNAAYPNTQPNSMNFDQIQSANNANGNIPITVKFGGYTWNVVYLTTNTNDGTYGKAGDLIATLWMSDTDPKVNAEWSAYLSSNASGAYYGAEYGISMMRMQVLNGGDTGANPTQYMTGLNNLSSPISATTRAEHDYAKFTMTNSALTSLSKNNANNNLSLIEYLASPSQVNYQKEENAVWGYNSIKAGSPKLLLNEAWGNPDTSLTYNGSGGWNAVSGAVDTQVTDNTNYYKWKDDYLWLPSMSETGFFGCSSDKGAGNTSGIGNDNHNMTSLWGIPYIYDNGGNPIDCHPILKSSANNYSRSSNDRIWKYETTSKLVLTSDGKEYCTQYSFKASVRPALHLNLTKAEANSKYKVDVPMAISKDYNGKLQGVENESWYTKLGSRVSVKYYKGTTLATPQNAGSYSAQVTIDNKCFWTSGDPTVNTRTVSFTITPKQVSFPTLIDSNEREYSPNKLYFTLDNTYDHDAISIDVPTALKSKISFSSASDEFTATDLDAGTYTMDVALKDSTNYEWTSKSGNELKFIIKPFAIKIQDLSSGGNRSIVSSRDSTVQLRMIVDANTMVHAGKQVKVNIVAKTTGIADRTIGSATLDNTPASRDQLVNVTFTGTPNERTYSLSVEIDDTTLDGKNYEIKQEFSTTAKLEEGVRSVLTWQLTANGTDEFGEYTDTNSNLDDTAFGGKPIVYDGRAYAFRAIIPTGYTLDTSFGVGGYEVVPYTTGNSNPGTNADKYTTRVGLKDSESNSHVCQITWEILKKKFDLTPVKWLNDGKMEYDEGNLIHPSIDPSTLPPGLLVDTLTDLGGYDVGPCGNATVTFKLDSSAEGNYEIPVDGGKDSKYTFTGSGDFEWTKAWSIVPAVFKLEWEDKSVTDTEGNTFNVRVLKDPRANGKVDYAYYLTDVSGTILDPIPLTEDDIVFSATDRKHYKALPTVHTGYDKNYALPTVASDKLYSNVFSVGGGSQAVTVALDSDSIEYTGKPVKLKVNIIGAATINDLVLTYYNGDVVDPANLRTDAPTTAGNYLVVITSSNPTVVLGGTTQFEFEITRSVVSTTWKTEVKPPVLNLKFGQLSGIAYDIVDSSDNPISSVSAMTAGNYKIRARITDTVNFIFDDDTVVTEWQEFTVREGDTLYDPADPANPSNPVDPDNPSEPTNPDDGKGNPVSDFFKKLIENNFPLWQICTIAVGGLLTLIFMIKAIQYGNRRKKAKGEAKKISAKTYAALLPVFDTTMVLAGLTNKVWSIIAFAIVGVTVLMFIIALIMRKGWKKAELAKEQAIEDSEQRKSEAEKQERRELQAQISQVGQGAAAGGADMSIIEEMRKEMEEQRRADEERHRQEMEAMKLMLANMMGRSQMDNGDMPYASMDDTDLLVQKVIAGLLPAVQQMMPEPTAYLSAPGEQNEELKALVEEQSEQIRTMTEQMTDLQNKLDNMSHDVLDAELLPDNSEEIRALKEEHSAQIEEQNAQIAELQNRIDELMQGRVEAELLPDQSDEIKALTEQIEQLKSQIADGNTVVVNADNSEELRAMADAQNAKLAQQNAEMLAMTAEMNAMRSQLEALSSMSVDELDDEDFDDEEEWDSILDEDDDDFVEAIVIDDNGKERKVYPNFRMRLKQSSDKNREWYAVIKNLFCSQKGVTYRVYKRVEKIRYQGQVIAVIGIAKRSIKLWLALKPYEYDARRYHHKDVSDKPRFVDVPMYVRVSSDRALTRSEELILALFQELNMEPRKRYNDRPIQELIFTLKHNRLLTNKQNKQLLCETMHVHDCDVLDDETAEKCIETKNVESLDESNIETVKLDDIDAKFQDGNRVTLDRLKKVGLVSDDCTGFTVTADKRLTKPLIIVANDFSLTAVKLIVLTGGRAIKLQTI